MVPISPGDIVEIAKFALSLYQACQAAPREFAAVGLEACGMRFLLRTLKMYVLDRKDSIFKGNKDGAQLRQELEEQGGRCLSSLIELEELLKRYQSMDVFGRLKWYAKGKAEVAEVQMQMVSSTTQLSTFCHTVITIWGLAVVNGNVKKVEERIKEMAGTGKGAGLDVNANVKNKEKLIKGTARTGEGIGLDVIEDALRRHPDNEKKAIKEVMGVVKRSSSREDAKEYKTLIQEYAEGVKKCRKVDRKGKRAQTPEGRGRKDNDSQLGVPDKRHNSAESGKKDQGKQNAPAEKAKTKAPSFTLECWLVKSFSAERKKQNRGQEQLKDMAKKFQASNRCLDEKHSLVRSILYDKNPDEDTRYKWYYWASRVERVESGEQTMVIVQRRLTPEALEKERKEAAKKRKEEKEKEEDRKKKEETKKKEEASKKKKEDQDWVPEADVKGKQGDGKEQSKEDKKGNNGQAKPKVQGKEQPDREKKGDKKPMKVHGQNNLHPDDAHGKDNKGHQRHDEKKHKDKSPSPAPAKGKH